MGIRVTSLNIWVFGAAWEYTDSDKTVAQQVITCLEDRRVLFGIRIFEDQRYCIESAIDARRELTAFMNRDIGSDLRNSIRAMRAAFRQFVENGGPEGIMYNRHGSAFAQHYHDLDPFSVALGELRATIGVHVAAMAYHYELEVEEDLATIMPSSPSVEDSILED